jgi:ribose-phosphate pyrophosphokinase
MIYEVKKFKDNQVTAKIKEEGGIHVKIRGNSYEDLFTVATIKEAWDHKNIENKSIVSKLTIFCLIGQRSDRRFNKSESFDLKVICNFINSMGFDKVFLLHPHSDTCLALINNSEKISHFSFVEKAFNKIGNPILISPDAGAYKSTYSISKFLNADLIPSNKIRINGVPEISIQGNVNNKKCLIVDDLADGGRTFKFLAEELKKQGATKVFLYVTHGQFNYGFEELKEFIDLIYCTNSYKDINNTFVEQYKLI